jgi:hypothetical protein
MQLVQPAPYQEALDKLGRKSLIGSMLTSAEWQDVPVELRERAFFSSQVENVRFLQRGRDSITDFLAGNRETLPNGEVALKTGSRAEFVRQMQEFAVREGMGPLDPKHKGGLKDITSEKRLGLIFDTQTRQAHDFGYAKQGLDPAVLNEFPAQRFIRVLDVKERRDHHTPHENQVYLKTDPVWQYINRDFGVPWGPWGWGCGHDVEDVDRDEAVALGLIGASEVIRAEQPLFNDQLKASLKGLDPDLVDKLKDSFGDQIEIKGDTMEWAKGVRRTPFGRMEPLNAAPRGTLEQAFERAGMDRPEQVTSEHVQRFLTELEEDYPLKASQVVKSLAGGTPALKQAALSDVQRFLNYVPPNVAASLHKLDVRLKGMPGNLNGEYIPGAGINLAETLRGTELRATTYHELTHWLHFNGPKEYRDAIRKHFRARTRGEAVEQLAGYEAGTVGKKDRWYERYAGRVYPGASYDSADGEGVEVPTRYLELLAKPDKLADYWKDPGFRETMTLCLSILW